MSSQAIAGVVLATGIWVIVGAALIKPGNQRLDHLWVSTSSDRVASRPVLVRAAIPEVAITGSIHR
jgi:hypothetical protein